MSGFNLSKKAAAHMRKNLSLNKDQEAVVVYSFEVLILNFFTLGSIYLLAWALHCLSTTFTAVLAIFILRSLSGGAHSESPVNCILVSALLVTLIGKITITYGNQLPVSMSIILIVAILLVSMKIISVFAPVDSPSKPITSESHRKHLRRLSLVAVVAITVLQLILIEINYNVFSQYMLAASLGIAWQTFTLTPAGHKFGRGIDFFLNKFTRR